MKFRGLATPVGILVVSAFIYARFLPGFFPLQHTLPQDDMQGDYDDGEIGAIYHGTEATSYKIPERENLLAGSQVLGESDDFKRIEVDLTNQKLYAFEGNNKVYDFPISSGLYDWTPRGDFRIWIKLRYSKMAGGSKALGTYYYLPNVPYIMYFSNSQIPASRGFGLHGTYWHNDFGRPKSHGCVNLRTADAEKLYYWATPTLSGSNSTRATGDNQGTLIRIYGKYRG